MSFKREGNDFSALNILKKRRVAELLAYDVPDDEATLMASGRYACTVCYHRPVFDTLDILIVHRKGKKHAANLQRQYHKQQEIADLQLKRVQREYLKRENSKSQNKSDSSSDKQTAPLIVEAQKAAQKTLLKAAPYNSCVKLGRSKPSRDEAQSSGSEKKLFFQPNTSGQTFGGAPGAYVPKRLRNATQNTSTSSEKHAMSASDQKNKLTDLSAAKNILPSEQDSSILVMSTLLPPPPPPTLPPTSYTNNDTVAFLEVPCASSAMSMEEQSQSCSRDSLEKGECQLKDTLTEDSQEKKRRQAEVQYYVKMKSDGWIKDHRTGKWVRDDDVEQYYLVNRQRDMTVVVGPSESRGLYHVTKSNHRVIRDHVIGSEIRSKC
ncbi:uncharacterized protein LOC144351951 [Saccoglossus kowalevskii]